MAKRVADKYLTDRDWDQEEEPEEVGFIKLLFIFHCKKRI